MFQSIKAWWNRTVNGNNKVDHMFDKLEHMITDIQNDRNSIERENTELREKSTMMAIELDSIKKQQLTSAEKKNGITPWVDVHSAEFDPEKGVQVELDWNTAFISYLRQNGITGKTEELVIQKWLALLYDDLLSKIEVESVEESVAQVTQPSEFQ